MIGRSGMAVERYSGSRVYEVLERRWGIGTTVHEREVTVTPEGVWVVQTHPRRLLFTLVNHGIATVRLATDTALVASSGLLVSGGGGTITFLLEEDFEAVTYAWRAVAVGGNTLVYVLEVVAQ